MITVNDFNQWLNKRQSITLDELTAILDTNKWHVFKPSETHKFIVLKLKDKTLIGHIQQQQLQTQTLRIPHNFDDQVLSTVHKVLKKALKDEEPEAHKQKLFHEFDFLWDDDEPKPVIEYSDTYHELERQANLISSARYQSKPLTLDDYTDETLESLCGTQEVFHQKKYETLQQNWVNFKKIYTESKDAALSNYHVSFLLNNHDEPYQNTCPACFNEGAVLETHIGLFNVHFAQKRICYLCWGQEHYPVESFLKMDLTTFLDTISATFEKERVYYRIVSTSLSKRTKLVIPQIQFNARYDMSPDVSVIYNTILATLQLREQFEHPHTEQHYQMIADILLNTRSKAARYILVKSFFSTFSESLSAYIEPPNETDFQTLSALVENLKISRDTEYILFSTKRMVQELISNEPHEWSKETTDEERITNEQPYYFKDKKAMLEMYNTLKAIRYFLIHPKKRLVDYQNDEYMTIHEILMYADDFEQKMTFNKELLNKEIRKAIKQNRIVFRKRGNAFVIRKEDVITFLEDHFKRD